MLYKEEFIQWLDPDGLMGKRINPPSKEEGNPLLETSIGYCFLVWLDQATEKDSDQFLNATDKLIVLKEDGTPINGLYNKKKDSTDLITRDDMIGLVAAGKTLKHFGIPVGAEIYRFGQAMGWRFSNNADPEFSAETKPWDRAFYLLADDRPAGLWDGTALCISLLIGAFFSKTNYSGKRLDYLMVKTIANTNIFYDLVCAIWMWRMKKVYGSVAKIFASYQGENHIFARYCPD